MENTSQSYYDSNSNPEEVTYETVLDEVEHQDVIQPNNEITQEELMPIQEEITITTTEPEEVVEEFIQPTNVYIKVNFPKSATPVDCVSATTNCSDKIVAPNKQLTLLQNRFYFIPVDCDKKINSDNYSIIKVYSTYADAIDVRYIKDGFACVMPLKHNFKIRQDMILAILF